MNQESSETQRESAASVFEQETEGRSRGILYELVQFILHNKKWWLTPIILMLLVLGALIVLGGSGAAPFIYTVF